MKLLNSFYYSHAGAVMQHARDILEL